MKQYLDALQHIIDHGEDRTDRTGVGTRSVFGYQMRFNLSEGFPAVTTKKLAWKSVVSELLWFLEGSTDERRLAEILYEKPRSELVNKRTIWSANAENQGKSLGHIQNDDHRMLGPVYGHQWRNFNGSLYNAQPRFTGTDQISWLVNEIQTNPDSRRMILSSWNPNQMDQMALPPCHTLFQVYVSNGKLSGQLYQRSADMFLGVPFNIASYSLFMNMLAEVCSLKIGDFVHSIGDAHIYNNHKAVVSEQLKRKPKSLPQLQMPTIQSLDVEEIKKLRTSDFKLIGYDPMSSLKADMAV